MRFDSNYGDEPPKAKPTHLNLTRPPWFDESVSPVKTPCEPNPPDSSEDRLVDAKGLLEALFAEGCRPTVRWVRDLQKRKAIPYYKIGRQVRFSIPEVREAIEEKFKVKRRNA
jgi:hypothetical protein